MRTLAIGDIHGCRVALETLADFVGFSADDTIVALGDYVDRGPDSRGVLEFLIDLSQSAELIPLSGNHEIMMLEARESPFPGMWLHPGVGGDMALASYDAWTLKKIPREHWEFIENCRPYHETETHIFVHANLDPYVPVDAQADHTLFWQRFGDPAPHQSGKTMVCGHTPQGSGLPRNLGHAVCIDTGACQGGWLTCLDTGNGHFWQANEDGETRMDVLEPVGAASSGLNWPVC